MNRKLLLTALTGILTISPILADTPSWDEKLDKIAALAKTRGGTTDSDQAQLQSKIATLKSTLATNNYANSHNLLQGITQAYPSTLPACVALSEELLKKLSEENTKTQNDLKKLYQDFASSLLQAKTTADLDPWLVKINQLTRLQGNNGHYRAHNPQLQIYPSTYTSYHTLNRTLQTQNSELNALKNEAQNALQIATSWQDYLLHLSTGDLRQALSRLETVSNLCTRFTYIPRSKVLTLTSQLSQQVNPSRDSRTKHLTLEKILLRITNKHQALALLDELESVSTSELDSEVNTIRKNLQSYARGVKDLDTGSFRNGIESLSPLIDHPNLGKLASETINSYLGKSIELPEAFQIKPNEAPLSWTVRYLNQLADNKSWEQLRNTMKMVNQFYPRTHVNINTPKEEDLAAIEVFTIGQNYDTNKEYLRAIVAYRQVLAKPTKYKQITTAAAKRMKALVEEYPLLYTNSKLYARHDSIPSNHVQSQSTIRRIAQEEFRRLSAQRPCTRPTRPTNEKVTPKEPQKSKE